MAVAEQVDLVAAQQAATEAVSAAQDGLIELSRFIHANPEIALQEVKGSAACADFLEQHGFTVTRGVADLPTAFETTIGAA